MPSTLHNKLHVAIIMDGNGRWARRRGLPRSAGHRAGVRALRDVIETAPDLGISILTLFAFSSDNWQRPRDEVQALLWLLRGYLRIETARLRERGARLTVIGRRDRLSSSLRHDIRRVDRETRFGTRLNLRIAIDYSARDAIVRAAAEYRAQAPAQRADFARILAGDTTIAEAAPRPSDIDLLIRTGGERRLSDFMLWESAYAELIFLDRMWPAFTPDDLRDAIGEFHSRERRFGSINDRPVEAERLKENNHEQDEPGMGGLFPMERHGSHAHSLVSRRRPSR